MEWSKTRGLYQNDATKVHNTNPIRLCRRFFHAKSFDFQAGDVPSTLGAFRLWFDFQTRSTLAARCKTAHPDRSTFRPGGCSPGRPRWAKCVFWVHISLNNDLANIKLTLQRVLNFGSSQKAQKCIKKRRRGCRKRWNSFDFQTDSTFVLLCPPGSRWGMQRPAGDLAGCYLLASRSMRSLQACRM